MKPKRPGKAQLVRLEAVEGIYKGSVKVSFEGIYKGSVEVSLEGIYKFRV